MMAGPQPSDKSLTAVPLNGTVEGGVFCSMNSFTRRTALLLAAGACFLAAPAPAAAQVQSRFPPDSFTNLKFFPKTIDRRTLINTMRGFTGALGVRCTYCHVGEEGQDLATYNFASDDKRPKRVARVMLDMVQHINSEHLGDVPDRPTPLLTVRCETCHRGLPRPQLLEDTLTKVLAAGGVDSASRAYRALRERYYGSGAYNFSERVLNEFARGIAAQSPDQAVGLLQLNAEFYPASGQVQLLIGEAYRQKGDTAHALESYRKALALDSTLAPARQRIQQLTRH